MFRRRTMSTLAPLLPRGAARATTQDIDALVAHFRDARVLVLTGAGLSTESGLRDYRSPGREVSLHSYTANCSSNNLEHASQLRLPRTRLELTSEEATQNTDERVAVRWKCES